MLALGSDATLRDLSTTELKGPTGATAQAKLADAWWQVAETENGMERENIRAHAAGWYQEALPGLPEEAKAAVEKRLEAVVGPVKRSLFPWKTAYLDDLTESDFAFGWWGGNNSTPAIGKHGSECGGNSKYTLGKSPVVHSICMYPASKGEAYVTYRLNGACKTFKAIATIGDGHPPASPLTFKVFGDDQLLWQSRPLGREGEWQPCQVSVSRVKVLTLRVSCPGPNGEGLWVTPLLSK